MLIKLHNFEIICQAPTLLLAMGTVIVKGKELSVRCIVDYHNELIIIHDAIREKKWRFHLDLYNDFEGDMETFVTEALQGTLIYQSEPIENYYNILKEKKE